MIAWRTEIKKLSDLKPWADNPRIATKSGIEHLSRSLDRFGLCQDIVCNDDLRIIGGHQRWQVLRSKGILEASVKLPSRHLTDAECDELSIRLNRNVAGDWNMEMLANGYDIDELKSWGFDEKDIGFAGLPPEEDECEKCPTCGKKMKNKK